MSKDKSDYSIEPYRNGFIVAWYNEDAGPQGARYYGLGGENSVQPMIRNEFPNQAEAEFFVDMETGS